MADDRENLASTYLEILETLRLDSTMIRGGGERTIVPTDRERSFADPHEVIESLPPLYTETIHGEVRDLVILDLLGRGGMGEVRLAEQVALGREVAVKSLLESGVSSGGLRSILQEAWLTGYLEHPNIVPIYTLGRDANGSPLIVMKRIEGTSWWEYLHAKDDATHSLQHFTLEYHLEILVQVCRAMEYAHDRGVIHRDLKPENIMIGRFGEVYILDWGIALSLREDLGGRLPLVAESSLLAGTPSYMAPEMTTGLGPLDERSDVYLLGAILHELLAGAPPHQGETLHKVMMTAYLSAPKLYEEHIPAELVSIAQRAMHREPEKRFQSVRELRQALSDYVSHRASHLLTHQAEHRLQELEQLLSGEREGGEAEIASAFAEARFGFQQALAQWEENAQARRGGQRVLLRMLEHELTRENLVTAQTLRSELEEVPEEILREIEELQQKLLARETRRQVLERLAQQNDSRIGERSRYVMTLLLAVFFSLPSLVTGVREDYWGFVPNHQSYFFGAVRIFVITVVLLAIFRKTLSATLFNRRLAGALLGLSVTMMCCRALIAQQGVAIESAIVMETLWYAFFIFMVGLMTSLRISAVGVIYLLCAVLMSLFHAYDDYILTVGTFTTLTLLGVLWSNRSRTESSMSESHP